MCFYPSPSYHPTRSAPIFKIHCLMEESQSQSDSDTSCSLPEDCVALILSLTSPRDACAAAPVCRTFRSAVDSDLVWERFLPPDYKDILSRAVHRVAFSSKKELVARLCHPLLIDGGIKSFCLDKTTGKKCFMLSAAGALHIAWRNPSNYWDFIFYPKSRFSNVAVLVDPCYMRVEATLNNIELSPKTTYVAYFIIKPVNYLSTKQTLPVYQGPEVNQVILLRATAEEDNQVGVRNDGWFEVKIKEFYYSGESAKIVKLSDITTALFWMRGMILEGIELRPKN